MDIQAVDRFRPIKQAKLTSK